MNACNAELYWKTCSVIKSKLSWLDMTVCKLDCNIHLPSTAFSKGSTCPLLNNSAQRELVRKTLQSCYPQCFCGSAGDWTRAVYLNMSDPNQQCPSNWTLVTTPIRGCGRSNMSYYSCDSVTFSVHGHTYSSVCGRILAYQRGIMVAFYNAHQRIADTVDGTYSHGPAGSRQHIWSFVGAAYKQHHNYCRELNCPCTNTNISWPYQVPSFVNNDYFCDTGNPGPGDNLYKYYTDNPTTYYTDDPLWDGEGAVHAPAVTSTLLRGFARLCPNLQMMTWR